MGPQARRASVTVSPISIASVLSSSPPANNATSPLSFGSAGFGSRSIGSSTTFPAQGKALTPFPLDSTPEIKILLLENVNTAAVDMLKAQGYLVEEIKTALGEEELIAKLKAGQFQAVGIRSKTKVTARVIGEVPSVSLSRLRKRKREYKLTGMILLSSS